MTISSRVQSGSITRGSTAIPVGLDNLNYSYDVYRQGINVRDISDISAGLTTKIRGNSDLQRTLKGRDANKKFFDDTLSPTILSGSSAEITSFSVNNRFSQKFDHIRENRDLGQSHLYDDGAAFFETTNPDNALHVINLLDRSRELPAALVDHSSFSAFDGKLDALNIIKSIDRSTIDHPYDAYGVKGSVFHDQDLFLRSFEITDRYYRPGNFTNVPYFLDTVETFGNTPIISISNTITNYIDPFDDRSGDVEDYVDRNIKDPDMKASIRTHNFYIENDLENFDKMATGGFVYEGEVDSLTYGGLKR